jgi:S1-C subfamily serine protease
MLGQQVIAIGNSLGEFKNTVSVGVISGLSRTITAGDQFGGGTEELRSIIQTDAAINQGNSGGPLLDANGNVIGMNTAIAQGAQNIGFAIPAQELKRALASYQKNGRIVRPYLGVRYVPITKELKEKNHLAYDEGVLIIRGDDATDLAVIPGSPADKAGLEENDIILEIDGVKLTDDTSLATIIRGKSAGDTVKLKISHHGEEKTVTVTLEEQR